MEKKISKIIVVDSNEKYCEMMKDYFLESKAEKIKREIRN